MPSTAELVCVPPERVAEMWPLVEGLLSTAVNKCGDWTLSGLEASVLNGAMLLWITWDGSRIRAVATTEICDVPRGRICRAVACAGDDPCWSERFAPIEEYAREQGCVATRIHGRPGWARVFRDYEVEWVALEKRLD